LKGHFDAITSLCFDPKGTFLMSTSTDRTVRLWPVDSFEQNKNYRQKLDLYATASTWSSNGKAVVIALEDRKSIEIYQVFEEKKEDGKNFKLYKQFLKAHDKNIISLTTSRNFLVSCSSDTITRVWDFEEGLKDTIDTKQIKNYCVAMSHDLEFLAISTSLGVRIYRFANRTKESRENNVEGARDKYELVKPHFTSLSGHNNDVTCLDFLYDSDTLVSSSRDGTWIHWGIRGDYKRGFQPQIITQCPNPLGKEPFTKIAVSPNGNFVAAISGSTLLLFTITGETVNIIENSHTAPISGLSWSPDSTYIATGDSAGAIRLFRPIN